VIAEAFAALIADGVGVLSYDPDGAGGNVFVGRMPPEPDVAVYVTAGGGAPPDPLWPHDTPDVQAIVRGAADDPYGTAALAAAVFDALHGRTLVDVDTNDATVRIVSVLATTSPAPMGQDEQRRHETSLNFRAEVAAEPTPNRPGQEQ
jgi:hypothetical protein